MSYIALDFEHGGFGGEVSPLTLYMQTLSDLMAGTVMGELDLKIKPNDGIYRVTAEALRVNKINLVEHDHNATSCSDAGQQIFKFLKEHSQDGADKLVPIGQNIAGDLEFMDKTLVQRKHFEKFISYRVMDTGSYAQLLREAGLIPHDIKGALGELVDYFGIEMDKTLLHTARHDTIASLKVLRAQIRLITKRSQSLK